MLIVLPFQPQIDEKMRQSMPRDILNLIEDCWRDSDGCSENFSMIYDRIQLLDMEVRRELCQPWEHML